jgi:VanZ family protein
MFNSIRRIQLSLTSRRSCRIAFIAWFVTLFALSSIPGNAEPEKSIIFADKIAHAIYFTVGSAAFMMTMAQSSSYSYSRLKLFIYCIIMAASVGVYDEWHQTFTENRDGNSPGDILANLTGGALGYLVGLRLIHRKIYQHSSSCKEGMSV